MLLTIIIITIIISSSTFEGYNTAGARRGSAEFDHLPSTFNTDEARTGPAEFRWNAPEGADTAAPRFWGTLDFGRLGGGGRGHRE